MTDDEIPLDIAGHESRDRASSANSNSREQGDTETQPGAVSGPDLRETQKEEATAEVDSAKSNGSGGLEAGGEAEDEEIEPVEVLVQLAKKDEIDPWDIDIVKVTDKFLDALDEVDIRTSGRALFYASVLLRMKSDVMLDDGEAEPEPEPWEQAMAGEDSFEEPDPFAKLNEEMDRRLERKRARGTPQTLDELVRDLRDAERDNWWKESREYDMSGSPDLHTQGTQELDYRSADQFRMDDEPTEADVTERTHSEDIDDIIEGVYAAVREHYEQGRTEVLFREVEQAGGSRIDSFLGLLFLSHRGQVRLQQDELFGDLWIQDPNAVSGSGEVAAD